MLHLYKMLNRRAIGSNPPMPPVFPWHIIMVRRDG